MTHVFLEALRFTAPELRLESDRRPVHRGFPLAVALKKFWLSFAPRYAPLLWSGQEGKVDPYARAPTQQLFQEDRTVHVNDIRFTRVSTSCIPSIAEFVSSFPFIKNLHLSLESDFNSSLAPLSQMRLLTHLTLDGATSKHLSGIVNVSVKNLHLRYFNGENLSSLFPQQEQQQGGRLQTTLRNLGLNFCNELTDISALAGFETLLELKLFYCSSITDLSSISKLKELRVVRVEESRPHVAASVNLEMNSFVNAVTRLEFLLKLEISLCGNILHDHVEKIATIDTLEKLKLVTRRASSESLSTLLDPQNLPNLRELELELWGPTSSPFKHSADSGPCSNLEKLDLNFDRDVNLDSTDISIIAKKFPNLQCLFFDDFQDGTDLSPLGDLMCLTELKFNFTHASSIQSASLESAIPKLINLKKLQLEKFPSHVDVKKLLAPLRKLEFLSGTLEGSTRNAIVDLVEQGHLPVFFCLRSSFHYTSGDIEEFIPELLEDRRKQRIEEEHLQQSKKEQQERQAERRERDQEEGKSERDSTVKKKKRKKK